MTVADAFITGVGAFLPGEPVDSRDMEDHLGRIGGRGSTAGRRALRWNGVERRHYALTPGGDWLHSNAAMCAMAVRRALEDAGLGREDLQHLATATTQGDLLVPGHASAVHGELGGGALELASFQSVCASALMAAKSAWLTVRTGEAQVASAAASEFASRWFQPSFYEGTDLLDAKGRLDLAADFLRFTLSDGAGAVVMEARPRPEGLSLAVEWIDLTSLAGQFDACMWAGAARADRSAPDGGWSRLGPTTAHACGAVALQQDFNQLKAVIRAWIGVYLQKVEDGRIVPSAVDHLLCHYSARSLREEIVRVLRATEAMIPEERWFSTLAQTGNVGSASIWIMLQRLMASGRVEEGQRILCLVPESGRATVGFMMLRAVRGS